MTDLILDQVVHFTGTEFVTLGVWEDLLEAGEDDLAQELLTKGLLYEHYESRLNEDPALRTPEQTRELGVLAAAFEEVLGRVEPYYLPRRARARYTRSTVSYHCPSSSADTKIGGPPSDT